MSESGKFETVVNAIWQIREKIDRLREIYWYNEAAVKKDLIIPLLRSLGWAARDSSEVRPEYTTLEKTRVDYALLIDDNPKMIVEVKPLETRLEDYIETVKLYMKSTWTPYAALTDGERWLIFKHPAELIKEMKVTRGRVDLCSRALFHYLGRDEITQLPPILMRPPDKTKPTVISVNWAGTESKKIEVSSWVDVWRKICQWLVADGYLNEKPIYSDYGRTIIAGSSRPFREGEKIANGFWMEKQKGKDEIWRDSHYLLRTYLSKDAYIEAAWEPL